MKKLWYNIFKMPPRYYYIKGFSEPLGYLIGSCFSKSIFESFIKRKGSNGVDRIFTSPLSVKDFCYKTAINREIDFLSEDKKAELSKELFWGSTAGLNWHISRLLMYESTEEYAEKYLKPKTNFIKQITICLEKVDNVIEIGSGNGKLIYYLYDTLFHNYPNLKITGVELNSEVISLSECSIGERRIKFVNTDFLRYVKSELQSNSLIFATGTLEFLLNSELNSAFKETLKKKNIYIALCEPVEVGFDANNKSTYRKWATAYSHNYKQLLLDNGFHILHETKPDFKTSATNLLTILATNQNGI